MKKIYVEITNSCNLNCDFCLNTNREKAFMKLNEFETVLEKIKDYTNLICLHVKGEPLLHPQLEEILWIIDKYNLKTNITTNAILLNKNLEIICKYKSVRQLNLSLHSILENKNVNIDKYLEDIYNCVESIKQTGIIVSYRLWNLENILDNDANNIIIDFLSKKYNIQNLKQLLEQNEWIKLEDKIFINQDTKFIWPNLNSEIINEKGRCLALKDQIAILVNGDVVPCCIDSEGELVLGNIFKQDLDDIFESSLAKEMRIGFQNNSLTQELCKRCGFLNRLENKRK